VTEITLDELSTRLDDVLVLDVRTRSEFDGSGGQACDPRQGHIPGARNVDISRLLQLTHEEILTALDVEPGAEIVAYCHSGSRSAVATQLLRGLGYEARNYVGSWHEWSRHDDLPVES
jgi:thiosulfate/3-mercaptopyruvate sulfurtransferase